MTTAPGGPATATGVAAPPQPVEGRVALVTGCDGFIGRHLVRRLAAKGWRVRGIDLRLPERGALPAGGPPGEPFLTRGDVRGAGALAPLLEGVDTLFHLASAHLEHGAPERWYEEVNVEGTRALAAAAAGAGVRRFVHTGSVGIYGHVEDPPADETTPPRPGNPYERTKLLGEDALREGAGAMEFLILRPGWVYGPGCPRTEKLLRAVGRRRFFRVGDGSNLRHPLFIEEMLDAFVLAADAGEAALGRGWIIVGPRALAVRELVATCARLQGVPEPRLRLPRPLVAAGLAGVEGAFALVGRRPPVSRRSLAFFENDNAFSGEGAARALGFVSRIDLEEGLRATLEAGRVAVPAGAA